mmetsp:Transcript_11969/g.30350  ORF Transcript_11969/g.30350 Transcript_11969/m.30350 type:complete len:459 (+) Transcript_11969:41-1417(+)
MTLESSSLLLQLRNGHFRWQDDPEQGLLMLAEHQSEFPVRIREAIQDVTTRLKGEEPTAQIQTIYTKVRFFLLCKSDNENAEEENADAKWYGPDIGVDTEKELEVVIRFFPCVLRETQPIDEIWEWDFFPIFWNTTCLKSLPFVPLIAELGNEYELFEEKEQGGILNTYQIRKGSPLLQIITNRFILKKEPKHTEEFYRRVEDASLSVLVRLKEKGFVRKKDAWDCIKNLLNEIPSLTDKRVRFFLEWDPSILQIKDNMNVDLFLRRFGTSLLDEFLKQCREHRASHIMLERFRTLFELGLKHYPKQLGFLFHREDMSIDMQCKMWGKQNIGEVDVDSYRMACDLFGEEEVNEVVTETISEYARGRGDAIEKLVYVAATNEKVIIDGLYTLARRDPNALITLSLKVNTAMSASTTKVSKKPRVYAKRKIQIPLGLISIAGLVWMYHRPTISDATGEEF